LRSCLDCSSHIGKLKTTAEKQRELWRKEVAKRQFEAKVDTLRTSVKLGQTGFPRRTLTKGNEMKTPLAIVIILAAIFVAVTISVELAPFLRFRDRYAVNETPQLYVKFFVESYLSK
jgi:hypothetical protein